MPTIPRISIEQEHALIGIKTTRAKLSVETPRPKMRIVRDVSKMQLDRRNPEFTVNWQQVNAERGLPGPVEKSRSNAAQGQQQAMEYIGETAEYGNYLSSTELGGNRVAQMERNISQNADMVDLNIGLSNSPPEINWDPGYLNISWSTGNMSIEWDSEYMPTFSVEPHSVEIFLQNRPYIRITVSEDSVKVTGRHVDENV